MLQKIKIPVLYVVSPVLVLFVLGVLPFSCTKKQIASAGTATAAPIFTTDSMHNNSKKYLALGDSYTIGTSVTEKDRYPVQTCALLKDRGINMGAADIIATNGWTTADLIAATKSKPTITSYDAVSLLIGVNNQYQGRSLDEYKNEFSVLIQRSIQLANGKSSHVFVLSVPDYSVTPFASGSDRQKIAAEIDAFNAANKTIAESYKVRYLDITPESRKAATDPSLVAYDGLHFSGKEYAVWSVKLAPMIAEALQ